MTSYCFILVVVICFQRDAYKRSFLLTVHQMGMDTEEYVYIFLENRHLGFGRTDCNIIIVFSVSVLLAIFLIDFSG